MGSTSGTDYGNVTVSEPTNMFENGLVYVKQNTDGTPTEVAHVQLPVLKKGRYLIISPEESIYGEFPGGEYDMTLTYYYCVTSGSSEPLKILHWRDGSVLTPTIATEYLKGTSAKVGSCLHKGGPETTPKIRISLGDRWDGFALQCPVNGKLLIERIVLEPVEVPGQFYSTRSVGNQPFSHSQRTKLGSSLNRVIYPKTRVSKTDINGNELDGSVVHSFHTIDDAVTISGSAKGIFEERDNGGTRIVEERTDILGKLKSIEYYTKGTTNPVKKVAYSYTFGSDLSDVNVSSTAEPGVTVPDDPYGKIDCKTKPLGYIRQRSYSVKKDGSRKNTVDYRRSTAYLTSKTTTVDKVAVTEEYGLFDARTGNPTLGRLISAQSPKEGSPKEIRNTLHLPYSYITTRTGEKVS